MLMGRLRELWEEEWRAPGTGGFAGATGATVLLMWIVARSRDGWVPILDSANVVFHEAGHPLFSIFGEVATILGGTLMQLLIPLVALVAFWLKRQAAAVYMAGLWFFENWLNIARYMADARAQELPLVGGGEHDWTTLFMRWGVLHRDTIIAGRVRFVAWLAIACLWLWLAWRWHSARKTG